MRMASCRRWQALLLVLLLMLALSAEAAARLSNRLAGHPAPYLALHGQDPVAWQEWNAETVARAKRENKLLFVSVGYFSCHWCHVMQRESYRNAAIAARLNRDFIPVKVDRELNGALDAALLEFAERLLGAAGWPLNVFVTPEGYPVQAVLYLPPDEFRSEIDKVAATWSTHADEMRRAAQAAQQAPARPSAPTPTGPLSAEALAQQRAAFRQDALRHADTLQGGFGRVSKFPMVAQLRQLLEEHGLQPDARLAEFLVLTLDQMVTQGLRDQVNGGFFRYTIDPDWRTPHFEKMLYDQAQLAQLYQRAGALLRRPDYTAIAHDTLDFILTGMSAPGGGYVTSLSALDARGREGAAYLWDVGELRRVLNPPELALVRQLWRLDAARPFADGYLPMSSRRLTSDEQRRLSGIHGKLRALGRLRGVPRDIKMSTALNGLALSAFSLAGRGVPRFERAARQLAAYVERELQVSGKLLKGRAAGRRFTEAELDDYAYAVAGLADFAELTGDVPAATLARRLAGHAWRRFHSAEGWRREERPLLATLRPVAALSDDAMPSASATLIGASIRLADTSLSGQAAQALAAALPALRRDPFDHASGLAAWRIAQERRQGR